MARRGKQIGKLHSLDQLRDVVVRSSGCCRKGLRSRPRLLRRLIVARTELRLRGWVRSAQDPLLPQCRDYYRKVRTEDRARGWKCGNLEERCPVQVVTQWPSIPQHSRILSKLNALNPSSVFCLVPPPLCFIFLVHSWQNHALLVTTVTTKRHVARHLVIGGC